jgi:putative lipoprotein (rSAM/lipoprotein system)
MKKQVIKFFDKIVVVLLGVVGLSSIVYSCMKYGDPVAEYGEIKGIVTDKETSKPIQNIQIVRQGYRDTTYTDADGKYAFDGRMHPYLIKFEDIDGEENGGDFKSKEIQIKFTDADRVGKYGFLKIVNIQLEKKEAINPKYGVKQATFKE